MGEVCSKIVKFTVIRSVCAQGHDRRTYSLESRYDIAAFFACTLGGKDIGGYKTVGQDLVPTQVQDLVPIID